ncbi:MAG: alanyl-tRNA editing protein [archaeon]
MKKLTVNKFWENPYLTESESKVIEVNGNKVKLDKTIFYAFSGGQESDSGSIGGINVLEAVKLNGDIEYVLERKPEFKVGDIVKVVIDFEKRLKIMKLHSAAHLVYELVKELTGLKDLIGSNVHSDKSRIDYNTEKNVNDFLKEVEEKTNEIVGQGLEVKVFDDSEKAGRRLWECGKWKMPCGGTHLKSTTEIGEVKLKRKNLGKGKERIEISLKEV